MGDTEAATLPPVLSGLASSLTPPPTVERFQIPNGDQILTSTEVYTVAVLICITFYLVFRLSLPLWLMPRPVADGQIFSKKAVYRGRLMKRWFFWLKYPFVTSDLELARTIGLDSLLVIRFVRFSFRVLFASTIAASLLLLPCYIAQPQSVACRMKCIQQAAEAAGTDALSSVTIAPSDETSTEDVCVCKQIDKYSLANVSIDSTVSLWAAVAVAIYLAIVVLMLLRREYQHVISIQNEIVGQHPPQQYTVLVSHLPDRLRNGSREIEDYFNHMFPDQVHRVDFHNFRNPALLKLRQVGLRRNRVLCLLERALAIEKKRGGKTLHHWTCCFASSESTSDDATGCCSSSCCQRTASVESYQQQLDQLNTEFALLKQTVLTDIEDESTSETSKPSEEPQRFSKTCGSCGVAKSGSAGSVAFVTFKSLTTAALVVQSQIANSATLSIAAAPDPSDVVWEALDASDTERSSRRLVSHLCFVIIVLFWGLLTSFIAASTSTSVLAKQFPVVQHALKLYPNLGDYLDQVAPLLLIFLVSLVNPILYLLVVLEGIVSNNEIERVTANRFLVFLIVQVFVFYSISGTVFKTLMQILQQPQRIVVTLAATIPKNAAFYIEFIVAKCFWTLMSDLLRIPEVMLWICREVVHGPTVTGREKEMSFLGCFHVSYPSPRNLSSTTPQLQLVLFIALTYSTIQPLVLPAALGFFGIAAFVYPNAMVYSNRQHFKSTRATSFNSTYWVTVCGLITSQLTLTGVLFAKRAYSPAIAVVVVAGVTLVAARRIDAAERVRIDYCPIIVTTNADKEVDSPDIETCTPTMWQYSKLTEGVTDVDTWWSATTDAETDASHDEMLPIYNADDVKQVRRRKVYQYLEPVLHEHTEIVPQI